MYDSTVCLGEDGIWGQLGSGVKVGRFRFWVGYLSSVLVIRSVSGDPGFAWMAFPVKFRGVSSVGSWPWSCVPHGVSTGVPRSRHTYCSGPSPTIFLYSRFWWSLVLWVAYYRVGCNGPGSPCSCYGHSHSAKVTQNEHPGCLRPFDYALSCRALLLLPGILLLRY